MVNRRVYAVIYMYFRFCAVDRLACLWRASENEVLILSIPNNCEEFKKYYDNLQEKISQLSVLDELLSGMYILPWSFYIIMNEQHPP